MAFGTSVPFDLRESGWYEGMPGIRYDVVTPTVLALYLMQFLAVLFMRWKSQLYHRRYCQKLNSRTMAMAYTDITISTLVLARWICPSGMIVDDVACDVVLTNPVYYRDVMALLGVLPWTFVYSVIRRTLMYPFLSFQHKPYFPGVRLATACVTVLLILDSISALLQLTASLDSSPLCVIVHETCSGNVLYALPLVFGVAVFVSVDILTTGYRGRMEKPVTSTCPLHLLIFSGVKSHTKAILHNEDVPSNISHTSDSRHSADAKEQNIEQSGSGMMQVVNPCTYSTQLNAYSLQTRCDEVIPSPDGTGPLILPHYRHTDVGSNHICNEQIQVWSRYRRESDLFRHGLSFSGIHFNQRWCLLTAIITELAGVSILSMWPLCFLVVSYLRYITIMATLTAITFFDLLLIYTDRRIPSKSGHRSHSSQV